MTSPPLPPSLPDAATFLARKEPLKPLQYRSAQLKEFVAGFNISQFNETARERLAELVETLENDTGWAELHDKAHAALRDAMADSTLPSALSEEVRTLWMNAAPSLQIATRMGERAPLLRPLLAPLTDYLKNKKFASALRGFAQFSAYNLHPPGDRPAPPPAVEISPLTAASATETPTITIHCGDPNCIIDHATPTASLPHTGAAVPAAAAKSTAGLWIAGIAAVAVGLGVGAYFINAYGKKHRDEYPLRSGNADERSPRPR